MRYPERGDNQTPRSHRLLNEEPSDSALPLPLAKLFVVQEDLRTPNNTGDCYNSWLLTRTR